MNIEESKNQIETLIEAWQLDEADLNQTDINAMQVLLKENQELKSQLKGTTHCFDEKEHKRLSEQLELLTSKLDEYDLIVDERNQLKKQLEERNIEYFKGAYDTHNKYYDQQQEFIKYLEDKIEVVRNKTFNLPIISNEKNYLVNVGNDLIEILQKYKSIIGVEDEKK